MPDPDPSPYSAFYYRSFRFFLSGNFLAVLGRQMLSVCVGWEVYRRTGSAFALVDTVVAATMISSSSAVG